MTQNTLIPSLPALPEDSPRRCVPFPLETYRTAGPLPEPEVQQTSIPLSHYLWILRRHWWKIALFIASAVAATVIASSRLVPIYESTATIDIDRQMPSAIIGQEASRTLTNDSDQFL